jgi:RNA ligase (TIGR02306 family)
MRNLVSIQTIKDVYPIKDSDFIEKVSFVDVGWQCVSAKGEFKPGDKCVYFEIDSFLPIDPKFEFLRKSSYRMMYDGTEGFRLKTVRLRGELSQGLAMLTTMFDDLTGDIQEKIGVIKFESNPEHVDFTVKAEFPIIIEKSDQTRIQTLIDYFTKYENLSFEETLKLDGTSTTIYSNNGEFGVCGKNIEFKDLKNVFQWDFVKNIGLDIALKELNQNVGLQLELVGPGIQKNKDSLSEKDMFLFNIWSIDHSIFLKPDDRYEILYRLQEKVLNITGYNFKHVPILSKSIKIFQECKTLEDLLLRADGPGMNAGRKEGHIYKSVDYIDGQVLQFKVISNNFLLKGGD